MGDNSDANEWHVVLTPHEYDTALRTCWAQIQRADTQAHDDTTEITWQLCNDDHVVDKGIEPLQPEQLPYLRILKRFDALEEKVESTRESSCGVAEAGEMSYEPEVVEDEDEQVIKQFQNSASTIGLQQQTLETQHIRDSPRVQFEVHYHSVYQVPVLYFILLDFPEDKRDIDAVYQYVLLRDWKDMLTEVGVMGGLTYAVRLRVRIRPMKSPADSRAGNADHWATLLLHSSMSDRGSSARSQGRTQAPP